MTVPLPDAVPAVFPAWYAAALNGASGAVAEALAEVRRLQAEYDRLAAEHEVPQQVLDQLANRSAPPPMVLFAQVPAGVVSAWATLVAQEGVLARTVEEASRRDVYVQGPACTSPFQVARALEVLAARSGPWVREHAVIGGDTARGVYDSTSPRPSLVQPVPRDAQDTVSLGWEIAEDELVLAHTGLVLDRTWCAPAGFDAGEAEVYRTFRGDGHSPETAASLARLV